MVILCKEKDTTAIQPGDTHRLKTQGGYANGCEMLDTPGYLLTDIPGLRALHAKTRMMKLIVPD